MRDSRWPDGVSAPAFEVPHLLQDGDPVLELLQEQVRCAGLPLGEGALQHGIGRLPVEAGDEVDREVVGGPEGGPQVGRRGRRHPGGLGERDLAGPGDDGVALLVEPPAPRTAGELQVLARRERGPAGSAVLGEALDHDGAGRHVDPERQRLGGEDDLEQPRREALLHRFAEDRDQPGVVRGHAALQSFEPLVVAEHAGGRRRRAARPGARRPRGWRRAPRSR